MTDRGGLFAPQIDHYLVGDILQRRAALVKRHKLFGFVPHEKQWEFIDNDTVRNKALVGANRGGKTTTIVTEAVCHAWGCRPYLPADHPNFRVRMPSGDPIEVPNRGQVAGEDYPSGIGQVIWPTFLEWLPKGSYKILKTERQIVRDIAIDVSQFPWADQDSEIFPYSLISFQAYAQGRRTFEGAKYHWVLDDEPPPQDIWIAQKRGLIDYGGKWMGAMTVLDGDRTYIYDQFSPSERRRDQKTGYKEESYKLIPLATRDNIHLREEDILEFEAGIDDPVERQVRIYGQRLDHLGTYYGHLWNESRLVVEDRDRDPESVYVVCCDAHPTKAYAIVWFEVNRYNQWHAFRESNDEKLETIAMIAEHMKSVEGWAKNSKGYWVPHSSRFEPTLRLIDPLAASKEKGTGMTNIQDFARNHQIYWTRWKKGSIDTRAREVREWLKPGKGPDAEPRLTFARSCVELIEQMPKYRERKPANPEINDWPGKFVEVDSDLVQCVIAAVNCGFDYAALRAMRDGQTGRTRQVVPLHAPSPAGRPLSSSAGYGQDHGGVVEEEPWEVDLRQPWRPGLARREQL